MFMWNDKKLKTKQHLMNPDGKSWCRCENGGVKLVVVSETKHPSKKGCLICAQKKIGFEEKNDAQKKKIIRNRGKRRIGKKTDNFLKSVEWKRLRYKALILNDGKCECCGRNKKDGVILHVDHIRPRQKYPELELVLSNLQILCSACNHGKGNWDETDWREPRLKVLMGEEMA